MLELAHPDYLAGKRGTTRPLAPDEAADIVEALCEQIDSGIEARAEVARRKLIVIACQRGCNACCSEMVMIGLPEAHAVARWLRRPEHADVRAAFLERYPAWRERAGDLPARIAAAEASGDKDYYNREMARPESRVMCAFNHEGACTIYPIRPVLCRKAHATDKPDLCAAHDPALGNPQQLAFKPLDDYVRRAYGLLWGAHVALRGGDQQDALCELVYQLVKDDP